MKNSFGGFFLHRTRLKSIYSSIHGMCRTVLFTLIYLSNICLRQLWRKWEAILNICNSISVNLELLFSTIVSTEMYCKKNFLQPMKTFHLIGNLLTFCVLHFYTSSKFHHTYLISICFILRSNSKKFCFNFLKLFDPKITHTKK